MDTGITDRAIDSTVVDAAMWAVEEHNRTYSKSRLRLQYASVAKVATERVTPNATIYFFHLQANYNDHDTPVLYQTAVWVHDDHRQMPILVGRLQLVEVEVGFVVGDSDEDELVSHGDDEYKIAAKFAVECENNQIRNRNRNRSIRLELEKVVNVGKFSGSDYDRYCITILAKNQQLEDKFMLYSAIVSIGLLDKRMECTGMLYLSDAQIQRPYVLPGWIPLRLLKHVRNTFTTLSLYLVPNASAPFYMMKTDKFFQKLPQIASSIGSLLTRELLIPFLTTKDDYIHDNALIALAEQLGVLVPLVGGVEYAHVLLPPLEYLCTVSQPVARNEAVVSLCEIGEQMNDNDFVEHFLPLLKRLADLDCFTGRASSSGLFSVAYPRVSESSKTYIRELYKNLCEDEDYRVRKFAVLSLDELAGTLEPSHLLSFIVPIYRKLVQDGEDSVRMSAVKCCTTLMPRLHIQDVEQHILPSIYQLLKDTSELVRCLATTQLYGLFKVVTSDVERKRLVSVCVDHLKDEENELRRVAVQQAIKMCRICDSNIATDLFIPCFQDLSSDSSGDVRDALSLGLMDLVKVFSKDTTITQIFPILFSLLMDVVPSVRLNIITKLEEVNQDFTTKELFDLVLASTSELAKDNNSSIRRDIVNCIPRLAAVVHSDYIEKLHALLLELLNDKVVFVSSEAAEALKQFSEGVEALKGPPPAR